MRKIFFSKCPECNEHGIRLFKTFRVRKGRLRAEGLRCQYCGTEFRVDLKVKLIVYAIYLLLLFVVRWLYKAVGDATVAGILLISAYALLVLVVEYFIPVKAVKNTYKSTYTK